MRAIELMAAACDTGERLEPAFADEGVEQRRPVRPCPTTTAMSSKSTVASMKLTDSSGPRNSSRAPSREYSASLRVVAANQPGGGPQAAHEADALRYRASPAVGASAQRRAVPVREPARGRGDAMAGRVPGDAQHQPLVARRMAHRPVRSEAETSSAPHLLHRADPAPARPRRGRHRADPGHQAVREQPRDLRALLWIERRWRAPEPGRSPGRPLRVRGARMTSVGHFEQAAPRRRADRAGRFARRIGVEVVLSGQQEEHDRREAEDVGVGSRPAPRRS